MESNKMLYSELNLVQETSTIALSVFQHPSAKLCSTLYIDKYLLSSDSELPKDYSEHKIGYVFTQDFNSNSLSLNFFSLLYSNKFVCKSIDETCEYIYYILYDEFAVNSNYVILRYSLEEIYNNRQDVALNMRGLIYTKIQDIRFKISYFNWMENYKQSISEWINYSITQNNLIQNINCEIRALKSDKSIGKETESLKNSSPSFGECLLCCDRAKNIVFLPCGHVVACLQCTVKNLKIELNRKINKKKHVKMCPLCKGVIKQAREIII